MRNPEEQNIENIKEAIGNGSFEIVEGLIGLSEESTGSLKEEQKDFETNESQKNTKIKIEDWEAQEKNLRQAEASRIEKINKGLKDSKMSSEENAIRTQIEKDISVLEEILRAIANQDHEKLTEYYSQYDIGPTRKSQLKAIEKAVRDGIPQTIEKIQRNGFIMGLRGTDELGIICEDVCNGRIDDDPYGYYDERSDKWERFADELHYLEEDWKEELVNKEKKVAELQEKQKAFREKIKAMQEKIEKQNEEIEELLHKVFSEEKIKKLNAKIIDQTNEGEKMVADKIVLRRMNDVIWNNDSEVLRQYLEYFDIDKIDEKDKENLLSAAIDHSYCDTGMIELLCAHGCRITQYHLTSRDFDGMADGLEDFLQEQLKRQYDNYLINEEDLK